MNPPSFEKLNKEFTTENKTKNPRKIFLSRILISLLYNSIRVNFFKATYKL